LPVVAVPVPVLQGLPVAVPSGAIAPASGDAAGCSVGGVVSAGFEPPPHAASDTARNAAPNHARVFFVIVRLSVSGLNVFVARLERIERGHELPLRVPVRRAGVTALLLLLKAPEIVMDSPLASILSKRSWKRG